MSKIVKPETAALIVPPSKRETAVAAQKDEPKSIAVLTADEFAAELASHVASGGTLRRHYVIALQLGDNIIATFVGRGPRIVKANVSGKEKINSVTGEVIDEVYQTWMLQASRQTEGGLLVIDIQLIGKHDLNQWFDSPLVSRGDKVAIQYLAKESIGGGHTVGVYGKHVLSSHNRIIDAEASAD